MVRTFYFTVCKVDLTTQERLALLELEVRLV